MRALKALLVSLGFLAALAANAVAQSLPTARPAEVGMSAERLDRVTQWLKADVDKGTIPGAVLMVVRNGKVAYFEAVGAIDPDTKAPMTKDAIFRIYSMTKPITSVAVMMLAEQGKLSIDEPISKYIPAFKDMKVGVETKGEDGKPKLDLVPAQRQISIQDLLRHTSGITYGFFGNSLVKKSYVDADVFGGDPTNEQFAEKIAKLPSTTSPERPGTTATPPTSSAVWSKSYPASRSTSTPRRPCSIRSA
jgi:CubicO group peptidase (beta-lactamase class C family)